LFRITYFFVPYVGQVQIGVFAVPLTLVWLLGMQNTINLLDGVDGLASGVVAIVALVLAVAAAGRGQPDVVLFSGALAGACLGFLLFNFHPARIFMGDSGSHFLGLTLGLLFGHRRILLAAVVLLLVAILTVVGDRLQRVRTRLPVPGAGRLLSERPAPSR